MTNILAETTAVADAFRRRYAQEPRVFYAPGRINLIGEHTDYNGGFVLPFAIDRGVAVAAAWRPDARLSLYSMDLQEAATIDLTSPGAGHRGIWLDYVEGMAGSLSRRGVRLRGANVLLSSSLAMGAGLASSAALEIALGMALSALAENHPERMEIVLAAQETEHRYVGTQSGIMDQYISMFAKAGSCLLLDCRSLTSRPVRFPSEQVRLIVCDTGVKHELATSEYNLRRAECEEGVRQLRKHFPNVETLRDVSYPDFLEVENQISEPARRRCRHVISENQRTLQAVDALENRELKLLGDLMTDSHRSLQMDYEVSCPELDCLFEAAIALDGVLGARMTGGGFGGCTINLMTQDTVERFVENTRQHYSDAFGVAPAIFEVHPSEGAREIYF